MCYAEISNSCADSNDDTGTVFSGPQTSTQDSLPIDQQEDHIVHLPCHPQSCNTLYSPKHTQNAYPAANPTSTSMPNPTRNPTLHRNQFSYCFRMASLVFIGACLLLSHSRPLEKRIERSTASRSLSLMLPRIKIKNLLQFRRLEDGVDDDVADDYMQQNVGYYGYDDQAIQQDDQGAGNQYYYQAMDDVQDDAADDQGQKNYYVYYTNEPTDNPTESPTVPPTPSQDDDFFRYIDDDIEIRKILPLELSDIAGIICASLSIALAVGGGIGPGAILVAVYIIVMDFPPKVAIPLSSISCLGVSLAGAINNANRRHPLTDRPIIDWDLILIMEPVTLLGAISGTYVNKILQDKVIVVLLVLLLSIIAHNTLKRARKMHHAEELYVKRILWAQSKRNRESKLVPNKSFEGGLAEADPPFVPKVHATPSPRRKHKGSLHDNSQHSQGSGGHDRSDKSSISSFSSIVIKVKKKDTESVKSSLLEEEADPLPEAKITYITTMFLFVIAMNVFKGGGAFESPFGVTCGSVPFWIVELLTACWLVGCTYLAGRYLLRRNAIKEAVGFDYVRGDIRWDIRTLFVYPSACLIAGFLSGTFGIGCPVVIGPMLLGIGVNPSVAAATSGMMNFFTSLAAASSYAVLGSLNSLTEYAYLCFIMGFGATFIGGKLLARRNASSTRKMKQNLHLFHGIERSSYMAYSMGMVVLVSALSMTVEALLSVMSHRFDDYESDGICNVERLN